MRALEITLRIHRNLAIPALQLPKVSAKTELGAGAAEGLGLGARSAILVVSPSLASARPGAETLDCDGACDEDLAGGDHRIRLIDLLRALNVAHRRHREGLGPTSWAEQDVETPHVCGAVGIRDDAGFTLCSLAIPENAPSDLGGTEREFQKSLDFVSGVLVSGCVFRRHAVLPFSEFELEKSPQHNRCAGGGKRGEAIHPTRSRTEMGSSPAPALTNSGSSPGKL